MLNNAAIIKLLKATSTLLALHGANPFQAKHYNNAALWFEKLDKEVGELSADEITHLEGVNKSIISIIEEIRATGTLRRWQELAEQTPPGLWKVLDIPGLGPKRVRVLWKELGIQSIEDLTQACERGAVAQLPGFGAKMQAAILGHIAHRNHNQHKALFASALKYAHLLEADCKKEFPHIKMALVGEVRRKLEVISIIEWLVATQYPAEVMSWLSRCPYIHQEVHLSGPFAWRGYFADNRLPIQVLFCAPADFYQQLIIQTGSELHLALPLPNGKTLGQVIAASPHLASEEEAYQRAGLPYIPPELREGLVEKDWIMSGTPALIEVTDLQGVLHTHTQYSDGKNSLEDMAVYCKELGYAYIGITDHSQSAAYAGGLRLHSIQEQHRRIDELNQQLSPFKILKGIEVDVLPDGSLDYPVDILATFDFIIASVHMKLTMNQQEATERLIKAISNPFTTILGHATGRLLLRRAGYQIDHQAVIDACAAYGVAIEINASPWRLDMDWRWVPYAIQKGVKLSINPDAHSKEEIHNMQYGVAIGRKGLLTKEHTLNAFSREEMIAYFQERKKLALQHIGRL